MSNPNAYPSQFYSAIDLSGPCLIQAHLTAIQYHSSGNTTTTYTQDSIEICTAGSPVFGSPAQNLSQFPCGYNLDEALSPILTATPTVAVVGNATITMSMSASPVTGFVMASCTADSLNASLVGAAGVYTLMNERTSMVFTSTSVQPFPVGDIDGLPTQFIDVPSPGDLNALMFSNGVGKRGGRTWLAVGVWGVLLAAHVL